MCREGSSLARHPHVQAMLIEARGLWGASGYSTSIRRGLRAGERASERASERACMHVHIRKDLITTGVECMHVHIRKDLITTGVECSIPGLGLALQGRGGGPEGQKGMGASGRGTRA